MLCGTIRWLAATLAGVLCVTAIFLWHPPTVAAEGLAEAVHKSQEYQIAGIEAYKEGDLKRAAGLFFDALALRPDHPTLISNLAAIKARMGDADGALALLRRYAAMGVFNNIAEDSDFDSLRGDAEFDSLVREIALHLAPQVASSVAFVSDRPLGLIEGIAYDKPRRRFLLTSVYQGSLIEVDASGATKTFLSMADHGLWGLLGVKIDRRRSLLWASSVALPQTAGVGHMMQGAGGGIAVNLKDASLAGSFRRLPIDIRHGFGDLAIARDGTVYITDSATPQIFVVPKGQVDNAHALEAHDFYSLQGIVVPPRGKRLIVADYGIGLLSVSKLDDSVRRIETPPGATLIGIDGLYIHDGALIAIQNGFRPSRVLRIKMDTRWRKIENVEVLEAAHPAYGDPTQGVVVGDDFYYIANSGWAAFKDGIPSKETLAAAPPLTVLRLPLN